MLRRKNAFIEIYKKFDTDLTVFDSSRESVQNIIDNYERCEIEAPAYVK